MIPLMAQEQQTIWPTIIQALSNNGLWVLIAICVLAATARRIVAMVLTHRERIAVIEERIAMAEAGLLPEQEQGADPKATLDYDRHHRA